MQSFLGYSCWLTIFKHFNINLRLQLSNRCLALRYLHKRLPYKIEYLKLEGIDLQVNDVIYKVGVVRRDTKGTAPKWVLDENKRGGVHYDVEQYGTPEKDEVWEQMQRDRAPNPEYIGELKALLVRRERFCEQSKEVTLSHEMRKMMSTQIASLKSSLAEEEQLLAHSKAKYSHYLQITTVSKGVARIRGTAVYDRQIHHAENYLIGALFKNAVGIDKVVVSEKSQYFDKLGYGHPLVKSAKFLEISSPPPWRHISKVENSRVHIPKYPGIGAFARWLIENWLKREPSIGTHFTASVGDRTEGEAAMRTIGLNPIARKENVPKTKYNQLSYCYILPLTETTDIVVCCEFLEINKLLWTRFKPYNLHFVVHPKGYAGPLPSEAWLMNEYNY